jgi:hypothetical protein
MTASSQISSPMDEEKKVAIDLAHDSKQQPDQESIEVGEIHTECMYIPRVFFHNHHPKYHVSLCLL